MNGERLVDRAAKKVERLQGFYAELDALVFSLEGEQRYRVKQWLQVPGRWRVEVETDTGQQIFLCDGEQVWIYQPGIQEFFRLDVDTAREIAPPFLLTGYLNELTGASSLLFEGQEKKENSDCYVISYETSPQSETVRLWLDKKSLFPIIVETYQDEELLNRLTCTSLTLNPEFSEDFFMYTGENEREVAVHCLVKPLSLADAKRDWPLPVYVPAYLPEDTWLFIVSHAEEDEREQLTLVYKGRYSFSLVQRAKSDKVVRVTEGMEEIVVGGSPGFYQKTRVNELNTLWWSNETSDFVLTGTVPITKLLQVAQSLQTD
jgi:outer membrane lipoprotein-sorting protein